MVARGGGRLGLLLFSGAARSGYGDIYFHSPRGSNNKLNEASNQVSNRNRLFDSQNNGAGGYQVGDDCPLGCKTARNTYDATAPDTSYDYVSKGAGEGEMYYYAGSDVRLEWTAQHGCGAENPVVSCDFVVQYMCGGEVRNGQSRTTIPDEAAGAQDAQFGRHESYESYQKCKARERNRGLFVADQSMTGRGKAIHTRQANSGARFGFECPEERDYYPYWHPTEWRDVAVITGDIRRCDFYRQNSQNVKAKGECVGNPALNNHAACVDADAEWVEGGAWGLPAPECVKSPYSHDNHLGSVVQGTTTRAASEEAAAAAAPHMRGLASAGFTWTVPEALEGQRCVLRVRYNVSTLDYDGWRGLVGDGATADAIDASFNAEQSPVFTDPVGNFLGLDSEDDDDVTFSLQLHVDTSQYGRTFEDRTHTFRVARARPPEAAAKKIHNLNVRGRRGNIVQVYPSVEYDFVPTVLVVDEGDLVHFQWTGSDANFNGNDGYGRQGTDRSNVVEVAHPGQNVPIDFAYDLRGSTTTPTTTSDEEAGGRHRSMFASVDDQKLLAYLGQRGCDEATRDANDPENCKVLNQAPAYFDGGLIRMDRVGVFHYASSRNNDFSNRAHKGTVVVKRRKEEEEDEEAVWPWAAGAVTLCALCLALFAVYALAFRELGKRPEGRVARSALGRAVRRVEAWRTMTVHERIDAAANDSPWRRFLMWWLFRSQTFIWLLAYGAVNVVMFLYGFICHARTRPDLPYYPYAKGAGSMLNLNCSLIIVPMCRNLLTFLRSTSIARVVPLDASIDFHRLVARVIAAATLVHAGCHYANFAAVASRPGEPALGKAMWTSWPCISGHLIVLLFLLMGLTATAWVRHRKFKVPTALLRLFNKRDEAKARHKKTIGGREVFALVHWCWVPALALLVVHGPVFWIWLLWPLVLYATDMYIKKARAKLDVLVTRASMTSTDVMEVRMRLASAKRFHYKPGQYFFIQVPEISKTEWHPFTISSSPETRDWFSVHIRCRHGFDWVNAVKDRLCPNGETCDFEAQLPEVLPEVLEDKGRERVSVASYDLAAEEEPPVCEATVPVASPCRQRPASTGAEAQSALRSPAVGRGEGLTKKLTTDAGHAYKENEETGEMDWVLEVDEGGGDGGGVKEPAPADDDPEAAATAPRRHPVVHVDGPYGTASEHVFDFQVLFLVGAGIGVTPFASIVKTIAMQHQRDTLDTPITKVYFYWICRDQEEFESFRAMLLGLVEDAHLRSIFELHTYITGECDLSKATAKLLPEMNQYTGRPNWSRIFQTMASQHTADRVGVFFCGPTAIGDQLLDASKKFTTINSHGQGVHFIFHKETF